MCVFSIILQDCYTIIATNFFVQFKNKLDFSNVSVSVDIPQDLQSAEKHFMLRSQFYIFNITFTFF